MRGVPQSDASIVIVDGRNMQRGDALRGAGLAEAGEELVLEAEHFEGCAGRKSW